MRISILLPILAGSGAALAQMQMMGAFMQLLDNSTDGKCHQLSMFQNVADLASDQKIQDAFTNGDPKKQQMGQAIVQGLNAMLDPLKKEQGLVDGCQGTVATDNEVFQCLEMQQVEKLNKVLANQTALDAMTKGNSTKQENLKKISAAFGDRVNAIKNNGTEMDYCKSNVDMRCISEKFLAKFATLGSDDAAVKAHFNNNQTQVDLFKNATMKAQQRLDKLKSDQALNDVCGKMPNILPVNIDKLSLDIIPTGNMKAPQIAMVMF